MENVKNIRKRAGENSIKNVEKKALKGDLHAEFLMGKHYLTKSVADKDYCRAFDWMMRAAQKGHSDAQNELANLLVEGLGLAGYSKKNLDDFDCEAEAIKWYRAAAKNGNIKAIESLVNIYLTDNRQDKEAIHWYKKAIDIGMTHVASEVGNLFCGEYGAKQNFAKAAKWYRLGVKFEDNNSQAGLADMLMGRKGVSQNYQRAAELFRLSVQMLSLTKLNHMRRAYKAIKNFYKQQDFQIFNDPDVQLGIYRRWSFYVDLDYEKDGAILLNLLNPHFRQYLIDHWK